MEERTPFFASRTAWLTALLLILILGAAIRLFDLTDPPLDFHPTRQILSALKARGMYYETLTDVPAEQKAFAVQQWKIRAAIEPEILERLTAFTYRFTGEGIWVARLYSSLFWLIGAVFLFLLARDLTSTDGALAAVAVYLFLPYAVTASRSFQPDPLMVMLIVLFWWAVNQWIGGRVGGGSRYVPQAQRDYSTSAAVPRPQWVYAILAGLFGGLAILVKFVAVFFVLGGGLGALLRRMTLREALKQPQVYVMSVLGILPAAAYTIYGVFIAGYLTQQFGGRNIPSLYFSPSYYLGWVGMMNNVTGGFILMLALLGLLFVEKEKLRLFLGLWAGYALFGIYFNYHISSHDYYSLPLIPVVALSIAPLADWFFAKLSALTRTRTARYSAFVILLFGIFSILWNIRADMKSADYRPQAAMWAEIKDKIGDASVAGLTEDYGTAAAYYGWMTLTPWPTSGDLSYHGGLRGAQNDFDEQFAKIAGKDYFIVANFADFKKQPLLQARLAEYPIFAQGDGYVIYDLQK